MDGKDRRSEIVKILKDATAPTSAVRLASETGVSRQVIVGDIAMLRAEGNDIIATARGYIMGIPSSTGRYVRKIACKHTREETEIELSAIVSLGGEVIDVIITHPYYGDMSGQLNLTTLDDVKDFTSQLAEKEKLLSELTDGTHLHTVACKDKETFETIIAQLDKMGMLISS